MKKEIKRITCMCGLCGKTHDIPVLQYEDNMQIKDKEVWYLKTVYYCKNMDEEYCPEEIMDENLMSAREAYRRENGLLSAKSIQHIREKYGLSQEEYDKLLGFEDGTTKEITMAEYLHAHPEHSAEDFRIIKEMIRNSWDNRYAKKMLEEHKEAFDQARYEKIMEDVKKEDLL